MIQNNTQNRRAAEEADKPLQTKGGNEKMTDEKTENERTFALLNGEAKALYKQAFEALCDGRFVEAENCARKIARMGGNENVVYKTLAAEFVWPIEGSRWEARFSREQQIVDLAIQYAGTLKAGFGGYCTGGTGGGEPNRTNPQFAEALYEQARNLEKMLSKCRF